MKISFELTAEDWEQFQSDYLAHSRQFQYWKIGMTLLGSILFFAYCFYRYFIEKLTSLEVVIFLVFSLLWIFFYPKKFVVDTTKKSRKMLEEGDNSALFGHHTLEGTEQYLRTEDPGGEGKFNGENCILSEKQKNTYSYIFPLYKQSLCRNIRSLLKRNWRIF